MANDLVVKDNALINASYKLDLIEQRIILLTIAKSKAENKTITEHDYITINVSEFINAYPSMDRISAYKQIKEACRKILKRSFSIRKINAKGNEKVIESNWFQSFEYVDNEAQFKILFTRELIPFIKQLEKSFTSYFIEDVANLTSIYAIRLYELIIAWRSTKQTPVFKLDGFRNKLGIEVHEYPIMHNFKSRVLDVAIKQINQHTNIQIELEQHKAGRKISGFSFKFMELKREPEITRDTKTIDWVDGEPESKLGTKPKRKSITKKQAEKLAKVGETWSELIIRLSPDYFIKDLN